MRSRVRCWRGVGHCTVARRWRCTRPPCSPQARRWRAIWEVLGIRVAALDGVTALHAAGLTGFRDHRVHLSVKHNAHVPQVDDLVLHKVIRRIDGELACRRDPDARRPPWQPCAEPIGR